MGFFKDYSSSCVYDGQWNDATLIARGLVLDVENQTVVATPFPKFFNALGARRDHSRSAIRDFREGRR